MSVNRVEDAVKEVAGDIDSLSLSRLGLLELDVLARRIADFLHLYMDSDLVNVTLLEKDDLVVRATAGNRTSEMVGMRFPVRSGIGGLTLLKRRPISVDEYSKVRDLPLPHLDMMVAHEGVGAAAGVPLFVNSEVVGLLFIGRRGDRPITTADLDRLSEVADRVSTAVGASMEFEQALQCARAEERQRLARDVHDELIPLLFGIGVGAQRAQSLVADGQSELSAQIRAIEALTASANSIARNAIDAMGSMVDNQDLPLRLRIAAGRFSARADNRVSVGVVGTPFRLDRAAEDALASVVTEALNNVMKHAPDSGVVVTLTFGAEAVTVAVMDDGAGRTLAASLEARRVKPRDGARSRFGLRSLRHRLSLLGGKLQVGENEDGGLTVRAWVPVVP